MTVFNNMERMTPLIRHITDTARWVATYRARESARPDAVFNDPFAHRLAGDRGYEIAAAIPFGEENAWSFVARTWLFYCYVRHMVEQGVDVVVNLACGLDVRPYRMELPATLTWVEVDLPDIVTYKTEVLAAEKPVCRLVRHGLDLADADARRQLLQSLPGTRGLVLTEGLIIYLASDEVATLGRDLAAAPTLQGWATDLVSPGLLNMAEAHLMDQFDQGVPRMQFAPHNGPAFFAPLGWKSREVGSMLKTGHQLNRLPESLKPFASYPEDPERMGDRPWSGVCLFSLM